MINIYVLAAENCMISAVYGVMDVLFTANHCAKQRYGDLRFKKFNINLVTITNKKVNSCIGIDIEPTGQINVNEAPDIIIVSGSVGAVADCCGDSIEIPHLAKVQQWLNKCKDSGSIICSVCTGSFVLAASGILNGKTATTHWRSADYFHKLYPHIRIDSEQLIVDNGDVICAGGMMSYMDLGLYITERFMDREVASDSAKYLVFDPVRQKQSPYVSFQAQKSHDDQPVLKAQEWLESHLSNEINIDKLADKVGLGGRTFKRRFKLATGENPLNYLQRIRVELVKNKLEKTTDSINKIVWSVGYEDISSFRQLFRRFTGITPKEYRAKFA